MSIAQAAEKQLLLQYSLKYKLEKKSFQGAELAFYRAQLSFQLFKLRNRPSHLINCLFFYLCFLRLGFFASMPLLFWLLEALNCYSQLGFVQSSLQP